ncbi:hypothetical protein A3A95_00235 [Candidatus Nomurabacteria bacterium RIFCSPLOWO2_01_FULL_39_18]|uniref:Uncharacterized protein n=1 Tax=Candidatus Nomurabacteria bacterium RIFCSPHIGHO2_01_FULL_40_24b TaxID=1801739 RepID=A0A1F6V8Z7_9BACT|nr:MAG: hypothetical protein A2647_03085 [Candidatus Nomurabacteria bacterium RIFCSPHIGHO2_01_FULL_40_24b]OGI90505.1 MAG: hypothetical protein A3A95_00235 [Candidatus Nomurabacteria bacterium RIFCSPLOWO2_01_FULL_39_18]
MKTKVKKIIPYCLILIILIGLLSPMIGVRDARAQEPVAPIGKCLYGDDVNGYKSINITENACKKTPYFGTWDPTPTPNPTEKPKTDDQTPFDKELQEYQCGFAGIGGTFWPGCVLWVVYGLFYAIPTFLFAVSAYFFNVLVSITLSGGLVGDSPFVSAAWAVVRDLSNIFFILILLYIAIKTILGMGGSEVKKMIAHVVLTALLINFSMFFTKIIIDTTNILALVFYNKVNVETRVDGQPRPYKSATGEKDISGGLYKAFDPTKLVSADFFKQAREIDPSTEGKVPPSILISMLIITGVIMGYAAYCFFQVGVFFLSRLIELWVLIIFSPYAFMSSSVPVLSKSEGIGWDDWWHRLLQVSFLAPIFMFFLYIIFKLIEANPFTGVLNSSDSMFETILFIVLPALVILIILKKATEKAKKLSGELGTVVMGAVKALAVIGVGAAAGGTALLARTAFARTAAIASRTEGAKHYGKARIEHNKALEKWEGEEKKARGSGGVKPTWEKSKADYESKSGKKIYTSNPLKNPFITLGGRINAAQSRSGEIERARQGVDEIKKKAGLEGVGDAFITGAQQENIEKTFVKDKGSDIERDIRRGHDAKGEEIKDENGARILSQDEYESANRSRIAAGIETAAAPGDVDASGKLTKQGDNKVENELRKEFNEKLKGFVQEVGKIRFAKLQGEAKEKIGMATRVASRTTSGTYDIRNLSGLKTDKREGIGAKATVGLIAAVAMGMRMGLKQGAGVEVGSGQGNALKDIGQIVTEALKNVKLDVKLEDGGGNKTAHGPAPGANAPK